MKIQESVSVTLACSLGIFSAIAMPAMADLSISRDDVAYEYGLNRIKIDSKSVSKANINIERADGGGVAAIEKSRPQAIERQTPSYKTPKHNPRI
jgi:hypothetical protein